MRRWVLVLGVGGARGERCGRRTWLSVRPSPRLTPFDQPPLPRTSETLSPAHLSISTPGPPPSSPRRSWGPGPIPVCLCPVEWQRPGSPHTAGDQHPVGSSAPAVTRLAGPHRQRTLGTARGKASSGSRARHAGGGDRPGRGDAVPVGSGTMTVPPRKPASCVPLHGTGWLCERRTGTRPRGATRHGTAQNGTTTTPWLV